MERASRRVLIATVLASALALGGCAGPGGGPTSPATGTPAPTAPGATGPGPTVAGGPPRITGTVTAGPICPVERIPPDPACAPRPVAGAVIIATDNAGTEVGRATSAADGTYGMFIGQAGAVLLTAQPVQGYMGVPQPVSVDLGGGSEVEVVDLAYDTGIR